MAEPLPDPAAAARTARENSRRSRKLFSLGSLGVALLLAYYAVTANTDDPIHLYQGLLLLFFAALPSLLWARRGGDQLPVFEVLMLTTANTYALPLLNGHAELRSYPPEIVTLAGFVALFFQVMIISTHAVVRGVPGRTPFFTEEVMPRNMQKYILIGLVLSTIYTFVYVFFEDAIPYEINSILRAVFYGIGLVSTFVQARRWGQNLLTPTERTALIVMLVAQVLMQFSTLFLVAGMSIIILALVGYVAGSRRVPVVAVFAVLAVLGVLHNGKSVMREIYWGENSEHKQVAFTELVPFYVEWVQAGFSVRQDSGEQEMTKKLFDRTSLLHILCLIASITPEHQPYLYGTTYAQIPAQFIPSFFWPDKPPGHISTYTLSIYYGLQREEDTLKTTIGFGMVAEAYANFGFYGVGLLAVLLGAFYKKVQIATTNSPLLSYPGLFLVVLMAWSFQTEWTLSIWLSSMYQACVGIMGLPFILRNVFG
jgi:hypothetical protein